MTLTLLIKKVTNANWYAFGLLFFAAGMAVLYGGWLWVAAAMVTAWLFGATSAVVFVVNRGVAYMEENQD